MTKVEGSDFRTEANTGRALDKTMHRSTVSLSSRFRNLVCLLRDSSSPEGYVILKWPVLMCVYIYIYDFKITSKMVSV